MRPAFVVTIAVLLSEMAALCQPVATPPGQAPPVPAAKSGARPPAPLGSPAPPPQQAQPAFPAPPAAPSPTTDVIDVVPGLAYLASVQRAVGRPLTFLAVFLFIGVVFTPLARRVIQPRRGEAHYGDAPDARTARHLAMATLMVWSVALFAACEAVGVQWFATLIQALLDLLKAAFGLLGAAIRGLMWVLAAGVLAYAISPRGRDFVLGLAGWYYLRFHPSKPGQREMDLGNGVHGPVVSTDVLHSTIQGSDGQRHVVPNAWLMKTQFNWDRGEAAEATPQTSPVQPPAPPATV